MRNLIITANRSLSTILLLVLFTSPLVSAAGQTNSRNTEEPAERSGTSGKANPGEDVEGGPITEGEYFRRVTDISPAEIEAADPAFRHLVDLIRTGQADKRIMRSYWFYRWRLEPFDRPFPENWRDHGLAILEDRARTAAAASSFLANRPRQQDESSGTSTWDIGAGENDGPSIAAGPGVSPNGLWTAVGPFNVAGRTTGLDRHPDHADTLYASVADGGLWRTTDRGQTWTPLTDFEETLSGGSVVVDPTDPDTIYFGTGEGGIHVDNYPGIGVLRSVDGGTTWTASNEFSSGVRRLAIHPSEPTRIYAAGDTGCFLSTDSGTTFNVIDAPGLPTGDKASDVIIRPDNPDWVYCAIWGGSNGGVYRSTDRGANWTFLDNGLPVGLGRVALAISRSNPDILIAGTEYGSGWIYKTDDGGDSWYRPISDGSLAYCGSQCWYNNAVGIDPVNSDILYAGGISAHKSIDGGVTWSNMSSGVHVDQHAIFTPTGGEVILANDGGIYHSNNHGGSWSEWSLGMDTTQFYGICRHETDDDWAMGGTQDNGTIRLRQSDGWREVMGADGGMCVAGPGSTGIMLAEMQNHAVRRSTNGGESWYGAEDGIGEDEPRPWVGILAVDPSDRNNMWTATNDVYRSMDAKTSSWARVGDNINCDTLGCKTVSAIEVAPSDSNIVYVGFRAFAPYPPIYQGARGGVFRSANALDSAVTWTNLTGDSFPYRSVRNMAVHADDPNIVYVVFAGLGSGKVWKTADGGVTWADHTGDLPDIPVNDILVDADNSGTLLAATDLGVFRSDNDGVNWYGFSAGLPRAAAIEFTYNRDTGKVRIGTHGRSIWEWRPSGSGPPVGVPDGDQVPGTPMIVAKLSETTMRVSWDVTTCAGADYNLFHGDLDDIASLSYAGAECDLGGTGQADVPLPDTPSGNSFFVIASDNNAGTEGGHGYDSEGTPRSTDGIGFCSITYHDSLATCP